MWIVWPRRLRSAGVVPSVEQTGRSLQFPRNIFAFVARNQIHNLTHGRPPTLVETDVASNCLTVPTSVCYYVIQDLAHPVLKQFLLHVTVVKRFQQSKGVLTLSGPVDDHVEDSLVVTLIHVRKFVIQRNVPLVPGQAFRLVNVTRQRSQDLVLPLCSNVVTLVDLFSHVDITLATSSVTLDHVRLVLYHWIAFVLVVSLQYAFHVLRPHQHVGTRVANYLPVVAITVLKDVTEAIVPHVYR